MNRKEFLKLGGLGGVVVAAYGVIESQQAITRKQPETKSPEELEIQLLTDFIGTSQKIIPRDSIESLLYNISSENESATAVHIGDGYFLTANHAVSNTFEKKTIMPHRRNKYVQDVPAQFKVLMSDAYSDVAIIRAENYQGQRGGYARIRLANHIPEIGQTVSMMTRLTGRKPDKEYALKLVGQDFYEEPKEMYLGRIILPAESLLIEAEGSVLKLDKGKMQKYDTYKLIKPDVQSFCSIMSYNGDSGSGVFIKIGGANSSESHYVFAGILTACMGIKNYIETPNHPMGYRKMQQTGSLFVHREPIHNMIANYLKEKENGIIRRN